MTHLFLTFSSLILTFFIGHSNVKIISDREACSYEPQLLGEFVVDSKTISLCDENIKESDYTRNEILKHELIHAIHHNFGMEESTFFPDFLLTQIVRNNMSSGEALAILLHYDGYINQEFEARMMQNLPDFMIGILLYTSYLYSLL